MTTTVTLLLIVALLAIVEIDRAKSRQQSEVKVKNRTSNRFRSAAAAPSGGRNGRPNSRGDRNRGRNNSTASQRAKVEEELPYYWVCPEVRCPEVSSSCQTVEYLVYEYQYEVPIRGVVNVRCQSCPYCLDLPYLTIREIRDPQLAATRLLSSVETYENDCLQTFQCPELEDSCTNVRQVDVLIEGRHCRQCPACFDNTIFYQL